MTTSSVDRAGVIDVGGHSLNVLVEGSGPPLLLLNGFARPLSSWDAFAAQMSSRTVIRLDLPGAGESPWPVLPQTVPSLTRLAALALVELGVDACDVVGFSQGGLIAQQLAYDEPGLVRRLVLASTTCGVGATMSLQPWIDSSRSPDAVTSWLTLAGLWCHVDAPSWTSIGFLGTLAHRTLVVCGDDDHVTPPLNSRVLADRIPRATLALVPGGHDLQDSAVVQGFIDAVNDFLIEEETLSVHEVINQTQKDVTGK
jgi:pimeloyl-ACP methyl ester carboxylesterase